MALRLQGFLNRSLNPFNGSNMGFLFFSRLRKPGSPLAYFFLPKDLAINPGGIRIVDFRVKAWSLIRPRGVFVLSSEVPPGLKPELDCQHHLLGKLPVPAQMEMLHCPNDDRQRHSAHAARCSGFCSHTA